MFSKAINKMKNLTIQESEHKLKLNPDIFIANTEYIWKRIIHEYSEHFGCYYYYYQGYLKITTIKNVSKIPTKLLSKVSLY